MEEKQIYKCDYCSYITDKKFNLNRHMLRDDHKIITNKNKEIIIPNKCDKCLKILSNKYNLIRHYNVCKGIFISKICNYCNKEFKNIYSKNTHLINCSLKNNFNNNSNNNNSNNNNSNNIIINNITNNIINTNINIVIFNPIKIDGNIFKTDHIDLNFLKLILKTEENNAVSLYTKKILDNPENHCIKKTNLKSMVSDVYTGKNIWTKYYDIELYPMIIRELSNGFQLCILKENENKKDLKKFNKLIEYLDYFSEDGYCNNDLISAKIKKEFKEQIQKLKILFYNLYKKN